MQSESYSKLLPLREVGWVKPRVINDVVQWLGMSGDGSGMNGGPKRAFFYSLGIAAAVVGTVNAINVLSIQGMRSDRSLFAPLTEEGSSWLTFMLFFWIVWLGWRLAPPRVSPRWKLLIHIPMAFAFSVAHVGGFLLLRTLVYRLAGASYDYGPLLPRFLYEFRKDAFGYALFLAGITLVDHLLRQQALIGPPALPATFDIRDGASFSRVKLDEILAVASAGNYVEFIIQDGRRLLMRSALSAIESELAPRGFLRTHRSWLVNAKQVTAIKPEGSGDYAVELENLTVPLSRRFPETLAKLRQG
jgi:hypothetical protein